MGNFEVVGAEGGEEVGLFGHSADVQIHDHLGKLLILEDSVLVEVVLVEEGSDFVVLEVAAELVQGSFELVVVCLPGVLQVVERNGFLGSLPLVGLSVALLPYLLVQRELYLLQPLGTHVVGRALQVPGPDYQLIEVLSNAIVTVSLSFGMQKLISA